MSCGTRSNGDGSGKLAGKLSKHRRAVLKRHALQLQYAALVCGATNTTWSPPPSRESIHGWMLPDCSRYRLQSEQTAIVVSALRSAAHAVNPQHVMRVLTLQHLPYRLYHATALVFRTACSLRWSAAARGQPVRRRRSRVHQVVSVCVCQRRQRVQRAAQRQAGRGLV